MKLKLLVIFLLLPLSLMAAQTNVNDNLLIKNNFQFIGGTPGLNKVLTSDASGFYTPQSLVALEASMITNVTTTAPFLLISGQGTHTLAIAPVGTVVTNNASPTFTGLTVNGNSTLGVNAASTFSTPGVTWTAVNGIVMNGGVLAFPATTAGTVTNGAANNLYAGQINGTASGGITTFGTSSDTNLVINGNNGAAFLFLKGRFTTSTNILGSVAVINTIYTNPTQQRADVKTGAIIPVGGSMQIWVASAGLTNKSIMSNPAATASWTNSTMEVMLDPGATLLYTNIVGVSVLDNQYSVTHYH